MKKRVFMFLLVVTCAIASTDALTVRGTAIDQCTIAPMIENYRTGLLWRLFMSCPEVQQGLAKLGMTSNP